VGIGASPARPFRFSETTMSEAKHTPGEWKAEKGFEGEPDRWCVVTSQGGYVIATIHNGAPGDTLETEAANARVMAASEKLLAAARRALAVMKATGESVRPGNALGALDNAIRKAEGRAS
jgi:hypothetical protein